MTQVQLRMDGWRRVRNVEEDGSVRDYNDEEVN